MSKCQTLQVGFPYKVNFTLRCWIATVHAVAKKTRLINFVCDQISVVRMSAMLREEENLRCM